MNNKKLLIVLLVLLVTVNYYNNFTVDKVALVKKIRHLKSRILHERQTHGMKPEDFEDNESIVQLNRDFDAMFFPSGQKDAIALGEFIQIIKSAAGRSGIKLDIEWGDPHGEDDAEYVYLPVTVKVDAKPEQLRKMLGIIKKSGKLFRIDLMVASRRESKYNAVHYVMQMSGFKQRRQHDKEQ